MKFRYLQFILAASIGVAAIAVITVCYFIYQINEVKTGDYVYWPYDSNGHRFARHIGPAAQDDWVSLREVSNSCQRIFVGAEDLAFYEHRGVIWANLWIAARINFLHGRIVFGASTITQQLVKNLFLWRDKSTIRKALEIIGALVLDASLSKKEQLELYLNAVEFGANIYGISSASQLYFKKPVADLNIFECGVLAGSLPFPKRHSQALIEGEFNDVIAKDIAPMMRAYGEAFPSEGRKLITLLEKAIATNQLRSL